LLDFFSKSFQNAINLRSLKKWLLCLKLWSWTLQQIFLHSLPVLHFTVMIHAKIAHWLLNRNIFINYINGSLTIAHQQMH
jgi:hypothetical protein